jgi:predicted transcriptional regulator
MRGEEGALELEARRKIYKLVEKNPGLHFREIQRRLGVAVGSLQYHLGYLEKEHLIKASKHGKFRRYFTTKQRGLGESQQEMNVLRKESTRKIILFLQQRKRAATNRQIAKAIGLTPSTTSFHLNSLIAAEVIEKRRSGRRSLFSLKEKAKTAGLLVSYQKSFLDELVDNFVDVWQQV